MKLCDETISILKNFASINPNIVIDAGSTIKTIAESKTIMAAAEIPESFDEQFGIYDLNEFLSVVGLFEEPEFTFDSTNSVTISSKQGSQSVKYYFSDPEILTSPSKLIKLPAIDYSFNISTDSINRLKRAAATLGVSDLVVEVKGTAVQASVTDLNNSTSNSFSLHLGEAENNSDEDASLVFNIANLKMISGDYRVDISSKLISQFTNDDGLQYWIALEKTSQVG